MSLVLFSILWAVQADLDFSHDVVPILRKHCVECHAGASERGDFSINTRDVMLEAGVVRPGAPDRSRLVRLIESSNPKRRMPPRDHTPLDSGEIQVIKRWIAEGLPWEPGFTFGHKAYEPPLEPRTPTLPAVQFGRDHPIDRIIDEDLRRRGQPLPPGIDDAMFLRRVYLDVLGILPHPNERDAFLSDVDPEKRSRLIADVLARDRDYAEHWLSFWNDLLRNDYAGTGYIDGGRKQISQWLYGSLRDNKPYDQFVRELIVPGSESEGFIRGIKWRGKVNASQTQPVQFAQNISQVFLGINMKCASCHDSFVDDWKLEDAYGLAAILSDDPVEIHRCDVPTGKMATPQWIFPELGTITPSKPSNDRLAELASLLTHERNGRWTRTIVNRIWHRLMGRGIVSPVDAMHTEPWNEDLLDHLASHFVILGYDLKSLIRWIVSSQAYQSRVVKAKDPGTDTYRYEGPLSRRMTAEQFIDAVWALTRFAPEKAHFIPRNPEWGRIEPEGKWIWSYAEASQSSPAGERVVFGRKLQIDKVLAKSRLILTCDNEYQLYVNRRLVHEDKDWPTIESLSLNEWLVPGVHELVIVARNAGSGPNPAALFGELQLHYADGSQTVIGTDESWQWTTDAFNGAEVILDQGRWASAVPVLQQSFLGRAVQDRIRESLWSGHDPTRTVRASMMKSDLLMRSLGRPNREQIVTTRPESLTTLQAIDLANGEILSDLLAHGATQWHAEFADAPNESIRWLYHYALSRSPTEAELALLTGALHDGAPGEDILWAIVMLPEFQWIR